MYQSVADGIGDCWVRKQRVPFAGRILRRYDYGSFLASVLDDFHKVGLFRVRYGFHDEVIDDKDFDFSKSFEIFEVYAGSSGGLDFLEEAFVPDFDHGKSLVASLQADRLGDIGFSSARSAGNNHVLGIKYPGWRRKGLKVFFHEAALLGIADVFQTSLFGLEVGFSDHSGQPAVVAGAVFLLDEHCNELFLGERCSVGVFKLIVKSGRHRGQSH